MKPIIFFVLAVAYHSALAQFGARLECFTLHAPEVILSDVKKLAVMPFEGKESLGVKLSDYLTEQLLDDKRGLSEISTTFFGTPQQGKAYFKGARTNVYTLLERAQIDRIIQEQKLAASGMLDDNQAVELGKLLGVDAMVFGRVTYTSQDQSRTYDVKDSKGNVTKMYSSERRVQVEAQMRVVSVKTGKILAVTSESEGRRDYKTAANEFPEVASAFTLADQCLRPIAYRLTNYISPYFSFESFEIEKIKEKQFRDKAKQARDLANIGQIEQAFAIYKAILEQDPYNAYAAYNVGILYEAAGDYAKAAEMYGIASQIVPNDRTFTNAKIRCSRSAEVVQQLKSFGIEIIPLNLEATSQEVPPAAALNTIRTKGSKTDRWEVYSDKSKSSTVVVKVPGDTEFEIVEAEGEWVKVKLLGGKQGYLPRESIAK